jgi:hypothetical protein
VWKMTRSASSCRQIASFPPRVATAILIAAHASWAFGCGLVAASSSRRLKQVDHSGQIRLRPRPSGPVGISVMSPADLALGRRAEKSS